MATEQRPSRKTLLLQIVAIAALSTVSGRLGQMLGIPPANVTAVWPPSGIALAAILRFGPRIWPGVWLGGFSVNMLSLFVVRPSLAALLLSSGMATCGMLEALVAAAALERFGDKRDPFSRVQSAVVFILISSLLCSIPSAIFGVVILRLSDYIPDAAIPVTFWTWWQGDVAGTLLIAPLLLTWTRDRPSFAALRTAFARPLRIAELALLIWLASALAWVSFGGGQPIGFLLIPLMIWAVFRFGPKGATATLCAVSGLAVGASIWGITRGTGLFFGRSQNASLLLLHAFLHTASVTTILLMAVIAERGRAEAALVEHSQTLEVRVVGRTAELGREVEERKRAEAALADHNRSLEVKVAERTAELNQINEQLEATVAERTADLRDKLVVIEQQQETLFLLSTPVLQIWDGVLVLPLVGTIDARRAAQIMEGSLGSVARYRARIFIIDITGVPFVDAEVADYLMRTARAARLLGVECMLVGISPKVAQVLVQSGADLSQVGTTYSTLQSGLLEAMRRMRYRVERA